MATRTLTQLIAEVRQRADSETDDTFVTDAEVTRLINESIKELYDLLITHRGPEWYAVSSTASTTPGIDSYSLPSTMYKLYGVDVANSGGDPVDVKQFMFAERNRFPRSGGWSNLYDVRYRLVGSKIQFIPVPASTHTYTLWYAPLFTDLSSGSDTFDGINGWEEYAVVDAAAKVMEKEDNDSSALMARKAHMLNRILSLSTSRDEAGPQRRIDVTQDPLLDEDGYRWRY